MIDAPSTTLTHLTESGDAFMVDVGPKSETPREATARATIVMQASTAALIQDGGLPKGDVLAVSRIAGLMGAKRTPDLIPLCHPIMITGADVSFEWDLPETTAKDHRTGNNATTARLHIHATVRTVGKTGVEMEALTAATVSALTIYDMCKAVDRGMTIDKVFLLRKSGGRSGTYDASHDLNGESIRP
ncbi:MAG: cyclic pyranopterin monophosphate synthase MoaC [Chloroflexi bacterium]|nr:cyclic pyranopterin monophosphate synthase MoaC [Chloroflexota bacterium]